MANALKNLSMSMFASRQAESKPTPEILGSGLASNAAKGLLMEKYRTEIADAVANGSEYPTFEEWMIKRR